MSNLFSHTADYRLSDYTPSYRMHRQTEDYITDKQTLDSLAKACIHKFPGAAVFSVSAMAGFRDIWLTVIPGVQSTAIRAEPGNYVPIANAAMEIYADDAGLGADADQVADDLASAVMGSFMRQGMKCALF